MSDSKPGKEVKSTNSSGASPKNVTALSDHKCGFVECKKKPDRAGFCSEHFTWFKEGLITKQGQRCADFEKKFYHFSKKTA